MSWLEKTLNNYSSTKAALRKVLLGLPFHGIFVSKGEENKAAIVDQSTYKDLLLSGSIENFYWDDSEKEHLMELYYQGNQIVAAYPTKKFIHERLKYTFEKEIGGVAIWDVAQGLDNLLDEL